MCISKLSLKVSNPQYPCGWFEDYKEQGFSLKKCTQKRNVGVFVLPHCDVIKQYFAKCFQNVHFLFARTRFLYKPPLSYIIFGWIKSIP